MLDIFNEEIEFGWKRSFPEDWWEYQIHYWSMLSEQAAFRRNMYSWKDAIQTS